MLCASDTKRILQGKQRVEKFQSDFELPIRQYVQEAAGDENSFNEIVPLFD